MSLKFDRFRVREDEPMARSAIRRFRRLEYQATRVPEAFRPSPAATRNDADHVGERSPCTSNGPRLRKRFSPVRHAAAGDLRGAAGHPMIVVMARRRPIRLALATVGCGFVLAALPASPRLEMRPAGDAVPTTDAVPTADAAVKYEALGVQGDLLVHERFQSQMVGERRVFVFLPSEYELFDERTYPVLYLLDGQNYFDPNIAAGGEEWAVDELLVQHPPGVPQMVLVGIQAGTYAVHEFSPPGSTPLARGDEYLRFIIEELKPFIDANYRTQRQVASTLIVGQGTSAVLALYAAWVRSDTFCGAIVLDFPDVDVETLPWARKPPISGRPWVWLEQTWSERARASTTEIVASLQRYSDTLVAVTAQDMHRASRILPAFRAMPLR